MNRRGLMTGAAAMAAYAALPHAATGQVALPPGLRKRDIRQKQNSYVVACRQRTLPDPSLDDTTSNSLNSRMVCQAPTSAALTDIVLAYPGFGLANPEADFPTAYTVTASIEYPAGTFTPVYVNGSRTLSVTPGRVAPRFDPCPINIPAGALFWVKTFAQWTAGHFWLSAQVASYVLSEWTIRGTGLSDNTLTSTTFTTTSQNGFGPSVFARLSAPTAVLGVIGDSISQSVLDPGDPTTGATFIDRAMRGVIPVLNLARSSDSSAFYLQRNEGRQMLARDAITHLLISMGRNDISGGAAGLQANIQKMAALFLDRGVQVFCTTVTPYTTSTNQWADTANQTQQNATYDGYRLTYNAAMRAGWQSMGFSGIFDWAHCVDPTDSSKWSASGAGNFGYAGYATLTGGAVSSVAYPLYTTNQNGAGGGFPVSSSVVCDVFPYPGDPGTGAVVNGNANGAGQLTSYTVVSGGAGYLYPPMISPRGAWTVDGIHPSSRGCNQIIYQTGLGPQTFLL